METNEEYLKRLLPLLKKPIPHSWRVQSYSKNKPVATVMAYIDQRDLMDVLDAYCTYGWQKKYEEIAGNLFCYVGVNMPDGTTQWRADCGVESNQDAEKGRASDAAKRAGVNWGVGRFLYDLKVQYVTTNAKKEGNNYPYCIDEQGKQIWDMTAYINNKNPNAPQAPTPLPDVPKAEPKPAITAHPILLKGTDKWNAVVNGLADGIATIEKVKAKNTITPEIEKELEKAVKLVQASRMVKA